MDIDNLERAMIEQLNAEVKGAGLTVKSLAALIGPRVGRSYDSIRNYMLVPGAKGQVDMPPRVLFAACDAVGLTVPQLIELAEQRMNRG